MKITPALVQVQLLELKGENQYRLSFFRNLDPLIKSLQLTGQTAPVLCRETQKGYQLFSGFLRRDAMLRLGKSSAFALVWKEKDLTEKEAFRFAFFENALTRGLNLAEQAKAVARLRESGFSDQEIACEYFQKAGIGVSVSGIDLLNLFYGISRDWQEYLTEKELSLKQIAWFLNLAEKEQGALSFLLQLKPTASQLRQILEMIEEIIKRDRTSIEGLIQSISVESVLKEKNLNANQKLENLLRNLKKLRYPEYEKLSARHKKILLELKISPEIKLEPIDYFEEPKYKLEMILESDTGVSKIFEQMLQASQTALWKKLFEMDED